MSQTIAGIADTVGELYGMVETFSNDNTRLRNEVKELKNSNSLISAPLQSLKDYNSKLANGNTGNSTQQNKLPRLFLGDSTIRDIVANENSHIHVQSKGGAKTVDILNTLKRTKRGAYSDIFIHVGMKNTATKFPIEKIVENITNIIDQAKEKSSSGHVVMSSICPRTDNSSTASKGSDINETIKPIVGDKVCVFVDHSESFLTKGWEIIVDFSLIDGLHLSASGTHRLTKSLGLSEHTAGKRDIKRAAVSAWNQTTKRTAARGSPTKAAARDTGALGRPWYAERGGLPGPSTGSH